ncbi:ABC-2 family transporter protein [Clostridium puniceum]|uniref:ABC-2 family transporter protein n=1 Tax=Clostridium puniceum TaxID=29367 RepID=A0A1S8TCP5_9CLOT|nr:ABC transporter permease [Clostridium puniceum]OOM75516.1 ABC-2 family transporter protein [Clostridium puniceum]
MFKLIQLEIKKFKIKGNLKGAIIANLIILASLLLSIFVTKANNEIIFSRWDDIFGSIGTFVRITFLIFSSVLISKLIISEYKNKTINILFIYPVNRKKLMIAKLFLVVMFTFIAMIISNIFITFSLLILNVFINFISESLTMDILLPNLINIALYSFIYSFISLIPVYVGILRKSRSSTILTSVILISVLNNGNKGHNLSSIIIIPIIFAIIGVISSYLFIKDVEKVDVVNF